MVIKAADQYSVPAGGALAVDRALFSKSITEKLSSHPLITIERGELKKLPVEDHISVIATGPLTSENLANDLKTFT